MNLKPWREIAIPHADVLSGTFQQAEFAADISQVHAGTAIPEYQDASLFFQRTFITEGMRLLLDSVVKRLSGYGGDPIIQLQTAFGGGKTHTLLAVYHLATTSLRAESLQGISPILDNAGITELPRAKVAVLDGVELLDLASKPRQRGACTVKTLWGELAWQLGGETGYQRVRESDETGTAPGKGILSELLTAHAPCIILMDELVRYVSQFEEGNVLSGGTYDTQLSFVQALTEAIKTVPNAILLASLPYSEREAGSRQGIKALQTLEHYFGRVQALWKPVATEEAFEIVRRRLFSNINDRLAAEEVCRAYTDLYALHSGEFPTESMDSHYLERMKHSYPIHPEVFDRLYEDWSSLENFQRTRGVLKFMAKVIHRLWKDNNNDLLIQPASLPLYDANTRNDSMSYLSQGWDPVLERDIDGERAATTKLDTERPVFGTIHACRRVARTIYLGSAPDAGMVGSSKRHRGLELERLMLGCVQPGHVLGHYQDAIRALIDKLQYLNSANNCFWFDTRPNLRREMEDRKRRFNDKEDIFPLIREKLRFAPGVFGGIHVFTDSGDVPDDWSLRLVVLPPDAAFSRSGHNTSPTTALVRALEILKNRGEQPRQKQNRLIFMAADADSVSRLKDQVRSALAWQSIVSDVKEGRLNLDTLQGKQASKSLEDAKNTLDRTVREAYKWLLVPMQEARAGKVSPEIVWEHFQINPATVNRMQEIEQILKENELLITDWAPFHLANVCKTWFWKDGQPEVSALDIWQKFCYYLYLPRLRDDNVLRNTLIAGANSRDFFGFAYGKSENRYTGFQYGSASSPILDNTLLLVAPDTAVAVEKSLRDEEAARLAATTAQSGNGDTPSTTVETPSTTDGDKQLTPTPPKKSIKKIFFGTVELNPMQPKPQFSDVVDEIVMLLNTANVRLKISVEIEAESSNGFDENIQRAVRENCNQLRFKNAEFES